MQTRQRHRHFATPENLLTVITLLEYRTAARQLLDNEVIHNEHLALRHPLHDIAETCTRELAFLQFAGLVRESERIIDGHAEQSVAELELQVAEGLLPGHNSAYQDLLAWRQRFQQLQLLKRAHAPEPWPTFGANPDRDNYLYQAWLMYELLELLHQAGLVDTWDPAEQCITFRWGQPGEEQTYQLQHDQAIPHHWDRAPGVRPDLYIARVNREQIEHAGELIWQEPGYVLDAKYYKPRSHSRTPGDPVKRMLADLHLTGEHRGALLFAFQQQPSPETAAAEERGPDLSDTPPAPQALYAVTPNQIASQTVAPPVHIGIWRICPIHLDTPQADFADPSVSLRAVLDHVHGHLRNPEPIACHGIFLDAVNPDERVNLSDRWGQPIQAAASDVLICPKPHIGPWRVDLVSRSEHCCQDRRLCHIAGRADARKPVRPPRSTEELLRELQNVFEGQSGEALEADVVQAIANQVESITRRFAEIAGAYRRLDVYMNRLRDMGMHRSLHLLRTGEQESLALALFLVEQLDSIGAQDYSAPAIHVSSVIEIANRDRIFQCPNLVGYGSQPKQQTLGTLPGMRHRRTSDRDAQHNWRQISAYTAQHWHGAVLPDEPEHVVSFDDYVKQLDTIAQLRNNAAHTHPVSRNDYGNLFRITCQAGKLKIGALNVLLLAWQE